MSDAIAFAAAFVLLLPGFWAIVARREAWPYSSYPMYSEYLEASQVTVFRLSLESSTGEVLPWEPKHFRLQALLGSSFERVEAYADPAIRRAAEQRFLASAMRLLLEDNPPVASPVALCIVRRDLVSDPQARSDCWKIEEHLVRRYPLGFGVGSAAKQRADGEPAA